MLLNFRYFLKDPINSVSDFVIVIDLRTLKLQNHSNNYQKESEELDDLKELDEDY